MAHEVFICYSKEDRPIADLVCNFLERNSIKCWVAPRDILPGKEWSVGILEGIEASKILVLIFSKNADASPQVLREVERAVNKNKFIIPFRIADITPSKALEYYLSVPHWLDALTEPIERHVEKLVNTILLLLGKNPSRVPETESTQAKVPLLTNYQIKPDGKTKEFSYPKPNFFTKHWGKMIAIGVPLIVVIPFVIIMMWNQFALKKSIDGLTQSTSSNEKQSKVLRDEGKTKDTAAGQEALPDNKTTQESKISMVDPVTGMEFVWVPGGSFEMGDLFGDGHPDEKHIRTVRLDRFWLGKYEVTQGEWQKIMGNNPSYFKKGDNYPVEQVSWNDAQEFIKKLNSRQGGKYTFRMPSEAEWEYAARSGEKKEKWAGTSDESSLGEYAWYEKNSKKSTHPVGEKKPNGLGLYDMSGNVWEWCEDIYVADYNKVGTDNSIYGGSGARRVDRGGGWYDTPRDARAYNRDDNTPGLRGSYLGFRLAMTPCTSLSEKNSKVIIDERKTKNTIEQEALPNNKTKEELKISKVNNDLDHSVSSLEGNSKEVKKDDTTYPGKNAYHVQRDSANNKQPASNANDAASYVNQGIDYVNKGKYDDAITNFNKALEINPRYVEAYYNRGLAYYKQCLYDYSISDCNKALEIDKKCYQAYWIRGAGYLGKGVKSGLWKHKTVLDCEKAIKINPRCAEAYHVLGLFLITRQAEDCRFILGALPGIYKKAIVNFSTAIEINPNDALAYYHRGVAYSVVKKYAEAWNDIYKAQSLGIQPEPQFLAGLRSKSGRQN